MTVKQLIIWLLILFFFLMACAEKPVKRTYFDFDNIKVRSNLSIDMPEESFRAAISLFSVPQIVCANIKLINLEDILYIKIYEKNTASINRHLIKGREYLYDPAKKMLHVNIDIPIVYIIQNEMYIVLEIFTIQKDSKIKWGKKIFKEISFFWYPSKYIKDENDEEKLIYIDSVSDLYPGKNVLKKELAKELLRTNLNRFNESAKFQIDAFLQ